MTRPKLVLIGGSAVRRGISARMLADRLSVQTLNFGLQASLGPELILHQARKVLRPGDTAMLVFEYNHYAFARWNDVALDAIFGCFTDFFREASLPDKLEMVFALAPQRTWQLLQRAFSAAAAKSGNGKAALEGLPEPSAALAHGDIPLHPAWSPPVSAFHSKRMALYEPVPIAIDPEARGSKAIAGFVAWAREHDVQVAMTWPNTIAFPDYASAAGLERIGDHFRVLGVPVVGEPSLGLYPPEYFYDTQYHMTPDGIRRRTADLARHLERHREILPERAQ